MNEIFDYLEKVSEITRLSVKCEQVPAWRFLKVMYEKMNRASERYIFISEFCKILEKEFKANPPEFITFGEIIYTAKNLQIDSIRVITDGSGREISLQYELRDYENRLLSFSSWIMTMDNDFVKGEVYLNYLLYKQQFNAAVEKFKKMILEVYNKFFKELEENGGLEELVRIKLEK